MIAPSTAEENERYRAGMCTSCGLVPHSAGRPRCEPCHQQHVIPYEPGLTPQEATA